MVILPSHLVSNISFKRREKIKGGKEKKEKKGKKKRIEKERERGRKF